MKQLSSLFLFLTVTSLLPLAGQQGRYLEEVFTDVKVTYDVQYGMNATALLVFQLGQAVPQPLLMDVYEPEGDNEIDRPLAILCHTGSFLPPPWNNTGLGTRADSNIVYLAKRLAKMGYVVVSMEHRMGWNPLAQTAEERRWTIAHALYRGIQDMRTCIRFFKKNAAEGGNTYKINPSKIMVWGDGSGGYLVQNTASLDKFEELMTPQFFINNTSFFSEQINGDVYGTSTGIAPPGYPPFPAGDTLCYPNHVGYDSDFQLAVSMAGAVIDTSWIEAGQPAMIAFHVKNDPMTPFGLCAGGCVPIIGVPEPVINVCGSKVSLAVANEKGLNDAFAGQQFTGDHSAIANARNEGIDGLFPFLDAASWVIYRDPWQWWNPAISPVPNPAVAKTYCDTMIAYVAPRACLQLGLNCNLTETKDLDKKEAGIMISPNPANREWLIKTLNGEPFESLYLYDSNGKLVEAHTGIHASQLTMVRSNLPVGLYVIKVMMKEGLVSQKIVLR